MKVFICTYTNFVKRYCDKEFFYNLYVLSKGEPVYIVDNSIGEDYCNNLKNLCAPYTNFNFRHIEIVIQPKLSLYHRRIAESVNHLRDIFLSGDCDYFFIAESDVMPPHNILELFEQNIKTLPDNWGLLGGLYHIPFHDFTKKDIHQTGHVLSGCTIYKRALIEKFPFRWSDENMNAFPDAWICHDSEKEFTFWNNHNIRCKHIEGRSTEKLK